MPNVAYAYLDFFWKNITRTDYTVTHLKSSNIMHPTLKVAARLLTCMLFGKDEIGTLSADELKFLYPMVHGAKPKPDFGLFLLKRLGAIRGMKKTRSPIHVSGLITKIVRSLGIPIQPERVTLTSDTYMGLNNLIRGHLLWDKPDKFVWLVGVSKEPYLELKKDNLAVLKLKRKISDTDWQFSALPDNQEGGDQQMGEQPESSNQPPETTHEQWHPDPNWYTSMNTNYQNLHTSISNLERDFRAEQTENQRFRDQYQQNYNVQQGMIESIFNWHISEHPQYAPPPPPPSP